MSLHCTRRWLIVLALALSSHLASAQSHYRVLHGFSGTKEDGGGLQGSVALDTQGSVYGTTYAGGRHGQGTVFELRPSPSGWSETLLYSFDGTDGGIPEAGPIVDGVGNVYGTTTRGGINRAGIVFQLSPSQGNWTETTLYNFCSKPYCVDGVSTLGSLMMDKAGRLYDTSTVIFELFPQPDGDWLESVLHTFAGLNGDALESIAGVIEDQNGNLYGTADDGGTGNCVGGCGIVYELRPAPDGPNGVWQERILHSFGVTPNDGQLPAFGSQLRNRRRR